MPPDRAPAWRRDRGGDARKTGEKGSRCYPGESCDRCEARDPAASGIGRTGGRRTRVRGQKWSHLTEKLMAERQGFEPWIEFPLYTLSKRAPSTTRPSLRFVGFAQKMRKLRIADGFQRCPPPPPCPPTLEAWPTPALEKPPPPTPLRARLAVPEPTALPYRDGAATLPGFLGRRLDSRPASGFDGLAIPERGRPIEPVPRAPPPPYQ